MTRNPRRPHRMSRRGRAPALDARRTLAASIERGEWERVALLLLNGLAEAADRVPRGQIDDVLALLAQEATDDRD